MLQVEHCSVHVRHAMPAGSAWVGQIMGCFSMFVRYKLIKNFRLPQQIHVCEPYASGEEYYCWRRCVLDTLRSDVMTHSTRQCTTQCLYNHLHDFALSNPTCCLSRHISCRNIQEIGENCNASRAGVISRAVLHRRVILQ